jgi:hypothetical protein
MYEHPLISLSLLTNSHTSKIPRMRGFVFMIQYGVRIATINAIVLADSQKKPKKNILLIVYI